ncbi:hypothetical protein UA08_08593 [Talaromyces atroroseus]|uniref:Uncharacterized protein n=1 Tax=Talaromyces atroroseus TaxID=1441469 RepID=A0A225ARJ0_TALAT|nr:hypothetical protein UA08_08593 [Talaromyces atroroseus]OKL56067.1 hypothetical protein UA08_08593 [Talaromyces atroroseus]
MESPSFKQQLSPSKTPLFPTSPERINQQRLSNSLSMPSDLSQKQSAVQSKIAFINSLSRSGSPAPSQQQAGATSSASAALQRAILGREEAESALSNANTLLAEAQTRERRISERLESLLEELQTTRERQAHERTLFEKEIRKARKEAFRAGSMLVKVQEELKLSRGEAKALKEELRTERESKEKAKQESFERAYALAGMSEELQSLKDQLRAIEANNQQSVLETQVDDLGGGENKKAVDYTDQATCTSPTPRRPKRSADAFELLQVTDSGADHYTQEETPTKKIRLSRRFSNKENQDPEMLEFQGDIIADLKAEIKSEQRHRERAEDMIHFLKMECQFKRCSCRIAESQGHKYVYDKDWENAMQDEHLHISEVEEQVHAVREETPVTSDAQSPLVSPVSAMTPPTPQYQEAHEVQKTGRPQRESSVAFCEVTGTFVQVSPPHAHMHDRPSEEPLVLPKADHGNEDDNEDNIELAHETPLEQVAQLNPHTDVVDDHLYDLTTKRHEIPIEQAPRTYPPTAINTQITTAVEELRRPSQILPITPTEQMTVLKDNSITKTVPIQFESAHPRKPSDIIPGTPLTREEALAQIRARRGRTRSTTQRSVSANEATARAGGLKIPPARRIPGVKHSDTRSEPDVGARRDTAPDSRRY